jgi:hypothetical protein
MKYAVCVKKEHQGRLCNNGMIWVGDCDAHPHSYDYVGLKNRFEFEIKEEAQKFVEHPWEHVVEVAND